MIYLLSREILDHYEAVVLYDAFVELLLFFIKNGREAFLYMLRSSVLKNYESGSTFFNFSVKFKILW